MTSTASFDVLQSSLRQRPRFEGCNVGTWIGFKHVMYLAEEGVLEWLRSADLAPGKLLREHALCTEIVHSRLRLVHAIQVDDMVRIDVRSVTKAGEPEMTLSVNLVREDGTREEKLASGRVKLLFSPDEAGLGTSAAPPPQIEAFVRPSLTRGAPRQAPRVEAAPGASRADVEGAALAAVRAAHGGAFVWKWRIPYFYCHYTRRIQHSGYIRMMEEVVDRFLDDGDISIATMLRERRWIPVVLNADVEMLAEALMEETIFTVYEVEDIMKDITYTARMSCYALRGGELVPTAVGTISHAYLHIKDRGVGSEVVPFDARVLQVLRRAP